MPQKQEVQVPLRGMVRSQNLRDSKPDQYSFAINVNFRNDSGDTDVLKIESSNLLATEFKPGYRVVGFRNDITTNATYFFITNPTTGISEFGRILDNQTLPNIGDTITSPDGTIELSEKLELQQQVATQVYETLLEDSCNKCLNLSVDRPIKSHNIQIKNEKCGNTIWFTDNGNPLRYIQLDNLDIYSYTGDESCGEDNRVSTCLDCNKLRVFKLYGDAEIVPSEIIIGGRLPLGSYEFIAAYSDNLGNELSEYFSLTQPIPIFDQNNVTLEQSELADRTNFAIKLNVDNLDKSFRYYKVVVIQTASLDGATRYYEEGIHPITDNTILYDTEQGKKVTDINTLFLDKPDINKVKGLAQANNYLIPYGIEYEKEVNLQPVVNLMGLFLKWQTHITTEDYYKNGINSSKGRGYHRDEVNPFSIRFLTDTGYKTAKFPFIARPATATDREQINNEDSQSIAKGVGNCVNIDRTERWQIYNTAVEEESAAVGDSVEIVQQTQSEETVTVVPSENDVDPSYTGQLIPSIGAGIIVVGEQDTDDFIDLEDYINEKLITCGSDSSPIISICPQLSVDSYTAYSNPPNLEDCDFPDNVFNEINIVAVVNETYNFITKALENYNRVRPLQSCNIYEGNGDDVWDESFSQQYALSYYAGYEVQITIRNRITVTYADTCQSAIDLQHVTPDTIVLNTLQTISHPYHGAEMNTAGTTVLEKVENIVTEKNALYTAQYQYGDVGGIPDAFSALGASGVFVEKIHEGALWFRIDIEDKEKVIVEISKITDASYALWKMDGNLKRIRNRYIRTHIFKDCFTNDPEETTTYEDENEQQVTAQLGGIFQLSGTPPLMVIGKDTIDKSLDKKYLYMVVDVPLSAAKGLGDNNYIDDSPQPPIIDTVVTMPLNSCFTINTREEEFAAIEVSYDSIDIEKVQKWISTCTYDIPVVDECSLIPNKIGRFAYWESTENYPDNSELYDSSTLSISTTDFTDPNNSQYFQDFYADQVNGTDIVLKDSTNFACAPIRHPKFPDNKVSPFMYDNKQSGFAPTVIYPLGVTIDEQVINDFLDIAVNNELISQEKRDSIVGYEIFRGDRTLSKSIEAKGILFDMYKYTEGEKEILYSNYPYNDLGSDQLNYTQSRNDFIEHPYDSESNHNFTFHSPNTDYLRPTLPTEMKIEGYTYGNSRGSFDEVEGHSKWTILGPQARALASKLATAEVIAEAAINIAQSAEVYRIQVGLANSFNPVGIFLNISVIVLSIISATAFKYGRYKYEWLDNFRKLGQPENFAYYYSSEGYYNYFRTLQDEGNTLRNLNLAKYIKDERKIFVDKVSGDKLHINNFNREESVFLSTGENDQIEFPVQYTSYDNSDINRSAGSRTYLSNNLSITSGRSEEFVKNIASPYVSLKNYLPSQYGTIDSVKWITTSYRGDLSNPTSECLPIYGGDTFISRHTLKRKIPLFLRDAFNLAPLTPFNYSYYSNIGSTRFYCDYQISDEVKIDRGFPDIRSDFNFDSSASKAGFYIKPPNKFYLYYYGIPNFLVESDINTNYRYGKKAPEENFYPNVGDYMDWTQQKVVPIKEINRFYYNFTYSKTVSPSLSRILPSTYNKEEFDCRYDEPNGGIYSLQDNSENDLYDPWLVFRPLDRFNFSSSNGELTEIRGIENDQVLVRFTDTMEVHNAVDTVVDDGTRPETKVLGNGGLFTRRTRDFSKTDLGKYGSQHSSMSSNEFGHFFVDAKRGSIIQVFPSSSGIKEISKVGSQNRLNGMSDWFKEQLPFKILNSDIQGKETINLDNPYNGIGIAVGFDDRYKRVFFTKKDYVPKVSGIVHENGVFTYNEQAVELNNKDYFTEASWTVAYDPQKEAWISYYDFKPNYYIEHNDYFQTGVSDKGLWGHNLTNKSFGVFYGEHYGSAVTYQTKNNLSANGLNTILFKSEAKRYHDNYDFAYNPDLTWNSATIWSTRENSGKLELIPQRSLTEISDYPNTIGQTQQEILVTNTNDLWSFDYFYNRVISERKNQPIWNKDISDIRKTLNPQVVSMTGKEVLENMSGTAFNITLEYDKDSRFEVDLQWAINTETT